MSYTTQVRHICAEKAGYTEPTGLNEVEDIISKSWDKIFDDSWTTYVEEHKKELCAKILKHYYMREICAETFGLWKLWLNNRMAEIMPYYNQLYASELKTFDPFNDVDVTTKTVEDRTRKEDTTRKGGTDNTRTDNLSSKRTDDLKTTTNGTTYRLFSDTPQGGLTGVDNEEYLTDATKTTLSQIVGNTGTQKVDNTGTQKNVGNSTDVIDGTVKSTGGDTVTIKGKRTGMSYSKLLTEYRETFINIDKEIINKLNDLFFMIY